MQTADGSMEKNHSVAIIGDNPEALLLSVLYAEAGITNYLVGPFGDDGRTHSNRPGLEEVLWLLGIFRKSGKITVTADHHRLPLSHIRTLILVTHAASPGQTNALEMAVRNIAPSLANGTTIAYTGLCKPRYTSSVVRSMLEKHSGLRVGVDMNLYYMPLFWTGERIQEFKEKRKLIAGFGGVVSNACQEELLRVFPTLSLTSTLEIAEASGLFSAVSREVGIALGLELANMSEVHGLNYDEVLQISSDARASFTGGSNPLPERESIATSIALSSFQRKNGARLMSAAHSINEEYQSEIVEMIKGALGHCGYPFRRSKVAILGTDGLLKNPWSKPESPPLIASLQKRGARISFYSGETGSHPWTEMIGQHVSIESSLLRAVAKANCTVVALPKSSVSELDPDQLSTEMNRPGAICDLTRVMEASNVEKAGLFYTAVGRGTFDT